MRIGIDGNDANVEKKVGVSMYTYNLLSYFQSIANDNNQFDIFLRKNPRPDMPKEAKRFKYHTIWGPVLWSYISLPLSLYLKPYLSLFFSPAHYTPRFCPSPKVVTIHDLSYLYYPQEFLKSDLYKLNNWTKHAVTTSKHIIAVSKYTKKDIIKNYGIDDKKISVIHNGFTTFNTDFIQDENQLIPNTKYPIQNTKYLLYVGTIQPRKNLVTLVNAYNLLLKEDPELKLVITGKKGWLYYDVFSQVKKQRLEDNVLFTDYIDNNTLYALYKYAQLLVLPSLYEGFGVPLLEAMSIGCPVIASNTSGLTEVGGDACLYFDPHDTISLKQVIKKVKEDNNIKQKLIEKGFQRVKLFSWQKCAEETLILLKSIS